MAGEFTPHYKYLKQWLNDYGRSGNPDQRAIEDYCICETDEAVKGLRLDLQMVMEGKFATDNFDVTFGQNRKVKYGSFEEWAKLMLQWIAVAAKR